ncbi:MAG: NAD(P)H-hydrate dehydratase [Clostridia bacterium]|nr:NAD(P)H-hydrate dehydratase [Clostridia bacterium]
MENISVKESTDNPRILQRQDLDRLPARPKDGHKGRFGRVAVVGGSVAMSGAGFLCAKAAYRTGTGLVELFAPEENRIIYQTQLPEALLSLYDNTAPDLAQLGRLFERADAVALGMGLSRGKNCRDFLRHALRYCDKPLILDADALNELSGAGECRQLLRERTAPTILTPHMGEAARLTFCTAAEIKQNRIAFAKELATDTASIVVLKDAETVITDGTATYINRFGNDGMATGGSGDVLAGIIAAFAVRSNPLEAACLGVLAHALAGDCAAERCGRHGLMASDIIEGLCVFLP